MQRILNDPDFIVEDYLKGFLKAHGDIVAPTGSSRAVKRADECGSHVGIVTGGGSGHEPAFIGYIGENLCDAAAVGEVFSSPTAAAFLEAFRAADHGKGVACLYGNYSGDNMNVKMAAKMAKKEGIEVRMAVTNDDVWSAPKAESEKRRGLAAGMLNWKCCGAKSAQGASLDEVMAVAKKVSDHARSVGIGLSPCTLPGAERPNFDIREGTMEIGIGHHGEPGMEVISLESASGMAKRMTEIILSDFPLERGDEVAVLVSGLGATPVMELYALFAEVEGLLGEQGVVIHRSYVGNYVTSLEMNGVTLTIMKLDDELKELIDMPCYSVGLKQR